MTTVTLRPNSFTDFRQSPTIGGGAPSHPGAQADDSDTTFSVLDAATPTTQVYMGFDNPTIPAGAQIRSVTPRVRFQNSGYKATAIALGLDTGYWFPEEYTDAADNNTIHTQTFSTRTLDPLGGVWVQASIDALTILENGVGAGGPSTSYFEAYIDVVYNEAPIVSVVAPVNLSSVTTTTRPTITWEYFDQESDVQERYQVKIFSAAQYGAGGFDPETSTPTWSSGEVFSAAVSFVLPVDLANSTTYRAYVKVADAGSNGRYGLWFNTQFTINVTAPPAPSLTVTAQPTNVTGPRTKLDIVRTADATPTTFMVIEYSDDNEATWYILRGASNIVNSPDGTAFTLYDYEAPPGITRKYRAKAVRTV